MRKEEAVTKEKRQEEQEADWLRDNQRWFKEVCTLATEALNTAAGAFDCTPEQLNNLLRAVDPTMLIHIEGGDRRLVDLAKFLEGLLEAEDEVGPARPGGEAEAARAIERVQPEASVAVAA